MRGRSQFPPEWHALGREAEFAAEQLASGLTALGKANFAEKGRYTQAFFGLSIGLERLTKLILIAHHAIENKGVWLTDAELRAKGHNIERLLAACEPIAAARLAGKRHACRPCNVINQGIVSTLSEFATQRLSGSGCS